MKSHKAKTDANSAGDFDRVETPDYELKLLTFDARLDNRWVAKFLF
jgi:hypothetical protein